MQNTLFYLLFAIYFVHFVVVHVHVLHLWFESVCFCVFVSFSGEYIRKCLMCRLFYEKSKNKAKQIYQQPYGKCRIQSFWSLTHTRD